MDPGESTAQIKPPQKAFNESEEERGGTDPFEAREHCLQQR